MPLIQIKLINGEPMGRPKNIHNELIYDGDPEGNPMHSINPEWTAFEHTVTYHPAPGCSESDGVEANLVDAVEKDNGKIEIYDVKPLYGIRELGWKEIKVWRLSTSQKVEVKEVDNWIKVEDRLPEESELVLICLEDSQDIYISFYKKDRKLFQVWGAGRDPICDMKTTHWMEMPKPPMYKCREMDCDKDATKEDYPGNAFYLCDEHYEKYHPSPPTH